MLYFLPYFFLNFYNYVMFNKPARVLVPTFCLNSTGLLTTLTTGTICVSSALDRYHSYFTSLLMHIVRHWTVPSPCD